MQLMNTYKKEAHFLVEWIMKCIFIKWYQYYAFTIVLLYGSVLLLYIFIWNPYFMWERNFMHTFHLPNDRIKHFCVKYFSSEVFISEILDKRRDPIRFSNTSAVSLLVVRPITRFISLPKYWAKIHYFNVVKLPGYWS